MSNHLHLNKSAGVSLVEMLISLMVFSVLVIPLMSIPMRAASLTEETKSGSILGIESQRLFNAMGTDVNLSYRFLPFWEIPASVSVDLPRNQMVFVAYWDEARQREVRVGYQLKELLKRQGTTMVSYSPSRWQLLKLELTDSAQPTDLSKTATGWKSVMRLGVKDAIYLSPNETGSNLQFQYCIGRTCSTSVNPKTADGVMITTTSSRKAFDLVYRDSRVSMSPTYFKLASRQGETNRAMAKDQILPISTVISTYSSTDTRVAEFTQSDATLGSFNLPASHSSQLGQATALPFNDFYYNHRQGHLLAVSNSAAVANTEAGWYIFQFKPGMPDYRPYQLMMGSDGDHSSYRDAFPVVVHQGDAAWLSNASWVSVTQDQDDRIYVLAKTPTISQNLWVLRFSPEGKYLGRFNVSRNAQTANEPAYISFNPTTPQEVLVFVKNGSGQYVIRSYPKQQNEDNPDRTIMSAQSVDLNSLGISSAPGLSGFNWALVKGMDYDALHNRYIFVGQDSTGKAMVLSMDSDLRPTPPSTENDGTPAQNVIGLASILNPATGTALTSPNGIAIDPFNNQLYISSMTVATPSPDVGGTTVLSSSQYARVLPNKQLMAVRRWLNTTASN